MYFILATVRHPTVAVTIQAESDSVLGNAERLPRMENWEHMPYVQNTILELMWQPVSPLRRCTHTSSEALVSRYEYVCVPHTATGNDQYKGYYIPKGTIV